jgi:plastocyanin domain-containing protein
MTPLDIAVIIGGMALIAGIALFFWGPSRTGVRATVSSSGYQEALVLVKGGYTPDVIVVQHGKPVRLSFRREETAACSEMVVRETVPVEFLPATPGEYEFACQMGMLRGKLVVE